MKIEEKDKEKENQRTLNNGWSGSIFHRGFIEKQESSVQQHAPLPAFIIVVVKA